MEDNNQTPNIINSDVLEQAGIGPIEIAQKPKKNKKLLLIAISAFILMLFLGITIAVLSNSSGKNPTDQNSSQQQSRDAIVSAQQTAKDITNLFAQKSYADIKQYLIHPLSPLAGAELNDDLLTAFVVANLDWTSCSPEATDSPTARHTDSDNKVYDVIYVPLKCRTSDDNKTTIEFDMRRAANDLNSDWQIYDLYTIGSTQNE